MFASIGLLLLLVMAWLVFSAMRRQPKVVRDGSRERESLHISNLPQIKQALADSDFIYLENQGYPALAKRIRKERRRIALNYLTCLRGEFEKLLRLARMVAVMSPNVAVAQEVQGLRLSLEFSYRYYLIYFRLVSGISPLKAMGSLSDMVSALTIRMETAMSELGERAALGAELLPDNRSGWNASS
jgi:UV DNA damage repair endonuclease